MTMSVCITLHTNVLESVCTWLCDHWRCHSYHHYELYTDVQVALYTTIGHNGLQSTLMGLNRPTLMEHKRMQLMNLYKKNCSGSHLRLLKLIILDLLLILIYLFSYSLQMLKWRCRDLRYTQNPEIYKKTNRRNF